MPKYIRTKDGIYEICEINKLGYIPKTEPTFIGKRRRVFFHFTILKENVLKSADTIEELCDGFWWENKMYDEPIFIPNYQLVLDRFNVWRQSDKTLNSNCLANITIYGSIYIKGKGWFHVAKMNESGVLELL